MTITVQVVKQKVQAGQHDTVLAAVRPIRPLYDYDLTIMSFDHYFECLTTICLRLTVD